MEIVAAEEKEKLAVSDVLPLVEQEPVLPQKGEEAEEELVPYEPPAEVVVPSEKPLIRFAEDIFAGRDFRGEGKEKEKKDKKKKSVKEERLEESKSRKIRKQKVSPLDKFEDELEE